MLFRGKALARLDLSFFDEVKNVVDYLGGDGLLTNQAATLQSNREMSTVALCCEYHNIIAKWLAPEILFAQLPGRHGPYLV